MQKKFLLNLCLIFGFAVFIGQPCNSFSQSVKRQCISSFGASVYTEDGIIFSQSVGQAYNTNSCTEDKSIVLQGFQQPNTYSVHEVNSENTLDVTIFPNPASYSLILHSEQEIEQACIVISDMNGQIVFLENVPTLLFFRINCGNWANGIYLISIYDAEQNCKTVKLTISK